MEFHKTHLQTEAKKTSTTTTTLQKNPGQTSFLGGELHNNNKQKAWKLCRRCCLRKTHTREPHQLRHQMGRHISPYTKILVKVRMVKNGWKTIDFSDALGIHFIGAKLGVSITTFVRMNSILLKTSFNILVKNFTST
jgi:hypothetical protein